MLTTLKEKFIGNRSFYALVMRMAVPIMIQNGITNFVNLLDNIMVGQVGTEQMSGVSIVNQLIFVFYLCLLGGLSGVGIFTAQYYGSGDEEGIRHTFRYKLLLGLIVTCASIALLLTQGEALISLFLRGQSNGGDLGLAMESALTYLHVLLLSLPAFMLVTSYADTLRGCGETMLPMKAAAVSVFVNLVFNYLLIFGHFGLPRLGVLGAAIATVIARYVELLIVVIYSHRNKERFPFIRGLYRRLIIPPALIRKFFVMGFPLLINETLWSGGMAFLAQSYSLRGLDVVAGYNIANTINNVFNIMMIAMGDSVAIIVGQLLGAGKYEEALDTDRKIIAFTIFISAAAGLVMFITAPLFPMIYNTSDGAKLIATHFLMAYAIFMPEIGFLHTAYFTIRSGGKTFITLLFDSVFMWVVSAPLAFLLTRFTTLDAIWVFVAVNLADLIKCVIGLVMLVRKSWIRNIVS